jgi:predicted nucleic acid-binding protein
VTVHLDTSVLVDALTGPRRSLAPLERTIAAGHVLATSTLVLYEWLRGPRTDDELADQEALLPAAAAREFGMPEAAQAARLWTLDPDDFRDLPGLDLYAAPQPAPRAAR